MIELKQRKLLNVQSTRNPEMTKAEFTLGKHNFFMFQTAYREIFSWMIYTGYNWLTTILFRTLSLFSETFLTKTSFRSTLKSTKKRPITKLESGSFFRTDLSQNDTHQYLTMRHRSLFCEHVHSPAVLFTLCQPDSNSVPKIGIKWEETAVPLC